MASRWLALLALLACSPSAEAEGPAASPEPVHPRVVAVGDLHGDLQAAEATLRLAGLIDELGRWSGGETILVQTGDTTDRGPDSRGVMALMRRLQSEAEAAGGKVIPLLGNHEAMNLLGDWRYVSAQDLAAYGGLEARREAFSPEGEDGRWLHTLDLVARVDDTVFVHGGLAPRWARQGIEAINDQGRAALKAGGGAILGEGGPLWFRDFVTAPEPTACPQLAQSLDALQAARMVVGHTTRRDGRIEARCEGRLLVIDIGIANWYGGNQGALEITPEAIRALYPKGPVRLAPGSRCTTDC